MSRYQNKIKKGLNYNGVKNKNQDGIVQTLNSIALLSIFRIIHNILGWIT